MLGVGLLWMSLWILVVIGALFITFPPLNIIASVLRLAWTAQVMRHVINLTVSEVLFVPAIEELIIITWGLILREGEDEFMFACAHCCLGIMESTFRHGNDWAFVLIAPHGKGFGQASQDARQLFERQGMEPIVDSDITQLNLLPHRSMQWFYLRYCCGCLDCQRASNLNCHSLAPVFFNWIPHGWWLLFDKY